MKAEWSDQEKTIANYMAKGGASHADIADVLEKKIDDVAVFFSRSDDHHETFNDKSKPTTFMGSEIISAHDAIKLAMAGGSASLVYAAKKAMNAWRMHTEYPTPRLLHEARKWTDVVERGVALKS